MHNYNKRNINRLRLASGQYTTNPDEVLSEQASFYQNLYISHDHTAMSEYLEQLPKQVVITETEIFYGLGA